MGEFYTPPARQVAVELEFLFQLKGLISDQIQIKIVKYRAIDYHHYTSHSYYVSYYY